jgi:hypothetical protein
VESDPEEDVAGKKDEENMVDADDIDSDDVPLSRKFSGSMAKRLRSSKGNAVLSEAESPKTRVKNVGHPRKDGARRWLKPLRVGQERGRLFPLVNLSMMLNRMWHTSPPQLRRNLLVRRLKELLKMCLLIRCHFTYLRMYNDGSLFFIED